MIIFNEFDDRFEAQLVVNGFEVCVSRDKPVSASELSVFTDIVDESVSELLSNSIVYIERFKEEYGIGDIDDLSEPQIMGDNETISVYWFSDKGEANGTSMIGVDFQLNNLTPSGINLGD